MEKKRNLFNIIIYIGVVVFSILFIFIGHKISSPEIFQEEEVEDFYKAEVIFIGEIEITSAL